MKLFPRAVVLAATFAAMLWANETRGQFTFASDQASNYGGAGEPSFGTGGNGGTGFDAWSFVVGGTGGGFIGNPTSAGIGGMAAESFALYANPTNAGNFINANRNLSTAMQVGDTFSFQWGANFDSDGPGSKGFNLYVGGTEIINVNMGGSPGNITFNGTNTTFGYGTNAMTWSFFYTNATTLIVTANDRDGTGTYSNSFTVTGAVDSFRWYAAQLNTVSFSAQREPYYNNLLVTNSGLYNVATAQTESRFLTGSGNLAKTGNGTLTISGATNNFTGTVGITNGAVRATASSALGSASSVTVQNGASLEYSGGITVGRNLTINGTGISTGGALRSISGNNTHSGNLTLGSASRIASDSGTLTISGTLSGSGLGLTVGGAGNTTIQSAIGIGAGGLTKEDAGTLTLSGANAYTGGTLISSGRVIGDTRSLQGGISNNAALTFDQSTNGTYSGALSGTGSVVKTNSGAVTFSGANSYSGGTLVAGGTLIGDTRSLQGAITNNAAVTFSQTTNGSYTGLMSGAAGTLTKSGSGTVTLTANNTHTGATTVSGGRLIVNGSQTNSAVTVNNGASLGGSGTVGALTVSGLLAPGNSIGTLSAGNTVFNGGGSFELEIFDWVNTAGTGWDLLAITGNLTLSNTSGSQFAINLVSLTNSTTPGLSTDWNPNVNFTNTFITYSGSLLGTSFASSLFTVNTGSFSNTINGTFSITNVTGGLALLYTTSFSPPSSTYNWSAGSGLWGTAGNWTNNAAPTNGASIIFSGTGGASTNSSTVSSIQGLVFTNGAGAYTVTGTAMAIGVGGISNASSATQTISNNLSLSANAAISGANGNVILAGNLTNGGNAVTVGGAANTTIGGVISGSGTLTKTGAGSLLLSGANTYTGATTVSGGTVVASDSSSLGATNGGTTVAGGATLQLSGGITTAENITITGSGVGNSGAIRSLGDGENTISGSITLGGNARINVDAPIGLVSTLASLGSGGFTVVEDAGIAFTTTPTSLIVTNLPFSGYLVGQFPAVTNWSSVSKFGLRMSATNNPNLPFEVTFYDSSPASLNTYEASTEGLTNLPSIVLLALQSGTDSLSSVEYMEFKFNGEASGFSLSLIDLVSVPTSGLNVSGNINGGSNVLTLGSAAGAADAVASGLTVTGAISGAGGSYSNTTTSLVKDGTGLVTLAASNSFTGDIWIEGGTLAASALHSLGFAADVFVASGATLNVRTNVTVASVQGTTTNSTGAIHFTGTSVANGPILNVSGTSKGDIYLAGDISGVGRLTLSGSGTTLHLSGNNTFVGATRVEAGTLALEGAGGDQALAETAGVAVLAGAKLLLNSSNQVFDGAAITLSGGTIERGAGVGEVFGNLSIAGGSILNFGSGVAGTLQFQGYTYTGSSLITVQNFFAGNRLQFLATSFTSANLAQFSFDNGFTTSTEGSYFTITAIPEPSTYAAALGLLGLMLWSQRHSLRRWIR